MSKNAIKVGQLFIWQPPPLCFPDERVGAWCQIVSDIGSGGFKAQFDDTSTAIVWDNELTSQQTEREDGQS